MLWIPVARPAASNHLQVWSLEAVSHGIQPVCPINQRQELLVALWICWGKCRHRAFSSKIQDELIQRKETKLWLVPRACSSDFVWPVWNPFERSIFQVGAKSMTMLLNLLLLTNATRFCLAFLKVMTSITMYSYHLQWTIEVGVMIIKQCSNQLQTNHFPANQYTIQYHSTVMSQPQNHHWTKEETIILVPFPKNEPTINPYFKILATVSTSQDQTISNSV